MLIKKRQFSFSILEKIEKNKVEKERMNIKNLFFNKTKNSKQLKMLVNYKQEYLTKIYNDVILGVDVHKWKNYSNFIAVLESIIKNNMDILKENDKMIEESFKRWSKNQIKLNIWKYLNKMSKKTILKTKKVQEEIINDYYIQLKFFQKGQSI